MGVTHFFVNLPPVVDISPESPSTSVVTVVSQVPMLPPRLPYKDVYCNIPENPSLERPPLFDVWISAGFSRHVVGSFVLGPKGHRLEKCRGGGLTS